MPQISDMRCLKHLSSSDDSTLDFWVSKYTLTALWMNKPESRMISYSLICKIGLQRTTAQHRLPWHTDRIFRFMITRFAGRWTDITDHRDPEWLSTRKENLHSSMMVAWLLLKNNNNKKKQKHKNKPHATLFQFADLQLSPLAFIPAGISNPTVTLLNAPAVKGWETYFQNPRKNVLHCGLCPWLAP